MAADAPRNAVTLPPSVLAGITGRPVAAQVDRAEYELARVELGARVADHLHDQNHPQTKP